MSASTDVAVVGIGCRFPDAWTAEEFWENLGKGVVSTREIPEEELRRAGVSDELLSAGDYVRVGTTVPGLEEFAAGFFGYPPAEAELIDPQQRIFLEVCWEALESAGHPARDGARQVGVFAGSSFSVYAATLQAARARRDGAAAIGELGLQLGGLPDFLASRVAYKLGLTGPSVAVQTACSSALTATHYAVLSLLSGECDIALAGGAGLPAPPVGYRYQKDGILSDDGLCRSFDLRSTGTGNGSGVGVVALRRLDDALASGDRVLAVIAGSAVGTDGVQRPGFTAPSPAGVADVVSTALRVGGVAADRLGYVEAHGSGTPLGDHVELSGLREALRETTERTGYCGLGSVKANIGHCGAAAGIAGLIKAVHVASTGSLPPHPLFELPRDPGLLADSPFRISADAEWADEAHRHVLVHSMGLGGTNGAIVLGPPPEPAVRAEDRRTDRPVRLVLSARDRRELDAASRRLADELDLRRHAIGDVVHTLRVGRAEFTERRVVTGSADELARLLRLPRPPAVRTVRAAERRRLLAVVPAELAERARPVVAVLRAAIGASLELVAAEPDRVPADQVLLVLADDAEDPVAGGDARHVLVLDGSDERIDAALTAVWLDGVPVRWPAVAEPGARRVPLPTYPFERRRFWALDPAMLSAEHREPATAAVAPATDGDDVETEVLRLWATLFGLENVGLDEEFGALGGTSMLGVQMALEIQQRHGVLLNLHRIGGTRATVRGVAKVLRAKRAADPQLGAGAFADGDGALLDADVELDLGPLGTSRAASGDAALLTGGTGFLGAFILAALLARTDREVYCLVRAGDAAEARRRLAEAARDYRLPEPDPTRVHVVPGDLRAVETVLGADEDGRLARRVGLIVHCAAEVVFTEPYRALRDSNVLATLGLLRWARAHGVPDFGYVSSLAACSPGLGAGGAVQEVRQQALAPSAGGYGATKWASERLLERAEKDGLRVRVFRPGLVTGSTETGACNPKDLVWRIIASGLAVGAHPLDDRPLQLAPADLVAGAIVDLAAAPASAGRAYHLVDEATASPRQLFEELAAAGAPTRGLPLREWQGLVAERALTTGNEVLASMALYELDDDERHWARVECAAWGDWLRRTGRAARADGEALRRSLRHLAARPGYRELLP